MHEIYILHNRITLDTKKIMRPDGFHKSSPVCRSATENPSGLKHNIGKINPYDKSLDF
jgi:hypothetical protein